MSEHPMAADRGSRSVTSKPRRPRRGVGGIAKGVGIAFGAYLLGCVVFGVLIAFVAVGAGMNHAAEANLIQLTMLPLIIFSAWAGVRYSRPTITEGTP